MTEHTEAASDVAQTLGVGRSAQRRERVRRWAVGLVLAAVVLVGAALLFTPRGTDVVQFETAPAWRGDLVVTVTATGTLQPVNQVEVGSEVSGTIESVAADYNDRVEAGQVLARLDTDQLQARVNQARAALQVAEARVEEQQATAVERRQAKERVDALVKKELASKEDLDVAQAAYARARAALASARAQVVQAQAQLDAELTTLGKAVIRSPIDGIVLSRNVEPGQTVAASFQTPVLFTLAEDLTDMELNVDVDEADVGRVDTGQTATFTVDAYPERSFDARITTVRFAPKVVQDVVTYEAVLAVDNSQLLLRPGMTATADIVTQRVSDALLVPNGALRFTPPTSTTAPSRGLLRSLLPGPPPRPPKTAPRDSSKAKERRVWVLRDGRPVAIPVVTGATNGRVSEIVAGELEPGVALLVDLTRRAP